MKRILRTSALTVGACLAFATVSQATSITWGSATNITGDSNVSTAGTLVGAFNIGGSGVGSTTVNGVTFSPFVLTGTTATSGAFTFNEPTGFASNNSLGSGVAPFSSLSSGYQTLLSSGAGDFTTPFTLTMNGLTAGLDYQFEWWWSSSNGFQSNTTATAGNSVTLNSNTAGIFVNGALGQFAIGSFTADATSQVITFSSADTSGLDAFQLRQVGSTPVPEPATMTTFGLGLGLAKLLQRRSRRKSS